MSIICLICKDKLLNSAPGSALGSLNSLIENQVIATGCGHLYHSECLQCWFRTQKKKLENQGVTGYLPDHCPTCQAEVKDEQSRRIYLLEDHREALGKAKLLEKMENLEIYCHQLEMNVHQLERENDLLINKALAPPKSPMGKDEFAAIVKNDRVMWLKKDSAPLSGVVSSIFKKEGTLWVKLKLDKKIRTGQKSGLLGSFRFDKKQEWTVPFEDIILEKEFKKNNIIDENEAISEPTTPTLFLSLQKTPSFRSSTLSLPGEYMRNNFLDFSSLAARNHHQSNLSINNNHSGSTLELSPPMITVSRDQEKETGKSYKNDSSLLTTEYSTSVHNPTSDSFKAEMDTNDHRDYVILNPNNHQAQIIVSEDTQDNLTQQQDSKGKHVTFADDLNVSVPSISKSAKGYHFRDHGYKNVIDNEMYLQEINDHFVDTNFSSSTNEGNKTGSRIEVEMMNNSVLHASSNYEYTHPEEIMIPELDNNRHLTPVLPLLSPATSDMTEITANQDKTLNEGKFNKGCFDITFTALFYKCDVFDRVLLLLRSPANDTILQSVQRILLEQFVTPIRKSDKAGYILGYDDCLFNEISHLCSTYLDLEELLTILFEYVYKIPPFISYSYEMCDYIHQFFIDFTDKVKVATVQALFERSLALQDSLKLCAQPSPALILQMPNSEDGIIHYDAVIPSLSLEIGHLLETNSNVKSKPLTCYCNKVATLECSKCAEIHGKSPVLFCDDCSVLLEAIHDQMYHKLELSPIDANSTPPVHMELAAIICLKDDRYSVYIRNSTEDLQASWVFIEEFCNGQPKVQNVPKMEAWLMSVTSDLSEFDKTLLQNWQRKILTECRMFIYKPSENSFA